MLHHLCKVKTISVAHDLPESPIQCCRGLSQSHAVTHTSCVESLQSLRSAETGSLFIQSEIETAAKLFTSLVPRPSFNRRLKEKRRKLVSCPSVSLDYLSIGKCALHFSFNLRLKLPRWARDTVSRARDLELHNS